MQTVTAPHLLSQEVSPRVRGLFLKNLGEFQTELARTMAGFVPAFVVWCQRKEIPVLVFRSLRRVQEIRQRCRELGVSFEEMHFSSNVAGRELVDKLCHISDQSDFLRSMIEVHLTLVGAIDDYLKHNEGIYDLPSVSLLEADREVLREQGAWMQAALRELSDQGGAKADENLIGGIKALCSDLPTKLREHNVRTTSGLKTGRQIGVLPFSDAKLPIGFHHLEFGPEPLPSNPVYADRERYHAINFLQEVQAADSCASMLFEAPDMPWDFFFDLSRHMWDEARHAMFGEAKLEALGKS